MTAVYSIIKFIFFGLLTWFVLTGCQTKKEPGNHSREMILPTDKTLPPTKFDTIIQRLKNNSVLTKKDILALKVIDSSYAHGSGETSYCDTTVQLNDSIFYSIINLTDQYGICSHSFILTIDEKTKEAISAKYLQPDCDIDYAQDSYALFEYRIISKEKIQLTQTTVFQKKNRASENEEENIDHTQHQIHYFIISPKGQISTGKI